MVLEGLYISVICCCNGLEKDIDTHFSILGQEKQALCFHKRIQLLQFLQLIKMFWFKKKEQTRFLDLHYPKGGVNLENQSFLFILPIPIGIRESI